MSCSLGTFPSTRQVAPAAPVAALRAAADRLQNSSSTTNQGDTRRPNYLLDVPVSAAEVDRWERRWREAKDGGAAAAVSSSTAAAAARAASSRGQRTAAADFQTAAIAYAAAPSPTGATHNMRHLAPFPPFVFAAVKTPPMTQLLKLRRQWLPHRQRFPVHQQRMGLLDAVLNHAVVALVGPNGSGRTLQVPIVLSETEVLKRRRLVVVSANATAARLTAVRLREERGEDVQRSRTVAAVVPCLSEANESTSVVVTTAEVLLRQLLCDPCLEDVGCVVLDDAHLRNEATELCLSLLRDLLMVQQQSEQQQQQQQQQQQTAAGGATSNNDGAAQGGAEAMRRRRLHVVLNCPDEATATSLLGYLAPARCKATTLVLQAPSALLTASTTLYLEETVQWLLKCEKEGSCLVRDGSGGGGNGNNNINGGGNTEGSSGTVESALLSYAENVDAVARVMAAGDADFARPAAFRQYWLALIRECVEQYDVADRQARNRNDGSSGSASPLPAILVVAPSNYHVHVIVRALQEAQEVAAEGDAAALRVCTALAEDCLFSTFLAAAQRNVVTRANQRWIVVTTSELSQTVLPSTLDVGFVVDCARNTYTAVDASTMADTCTTEYSSITQLRYRRRLAKVQSSDGADANRGALAPVVVQLIPKSVLHSAQQRRLNVDPAQHIVFRLPFHRYVQLYQVLQAREEAVLAQRAAVALSHGGNPHSNNSSSRTGEAAPTMATRVSALLSAMLMGVPAATANKYETVRRVMTAVEAYLRAAAHLALETESGVGGSNNSSSNGRLALLPMGVLSLCLPVPLPVARLLVAGSLLRPSLAALTALGALWCCSDLLSLQGVGVVHAADASDTTRETVEEQAALLGEARLFFSRDSLSDVVSAFHVYQMWCSVRGNAAQERDFLEECGVSSQVLTAVFETQLGLCTVVRAFHLLSAPAAAAAAVDGGVEASVSSVERAESPAEKALRSTIIQFNASAEDVAGLRDALGAAMAGLSQDVSTSRALHACVTAALYPSCVVPTGEDGVGVLYDPFSVETGATAAAASAHGGVGRRVVSLAEDSVLADATQAAKAAGRPFLFLAKSIASETAREAAGGQPQSSAAVVELLNPLHEAAALIFCGHTFERPRKPPLRCRGWSSVLTSSWRHTRRARFLPPVAQLPPVAIPVHPYDTVHCQQVVCTVDQSFSVTLRSTTAQWLQRLRSTVRGQLTCLVRGVDAAQGDGEAAAYPAVGAELAEAWAWWERRHAQGREWLREERAVVAAQQQQQEREKGAAAGADDEEQSAAAAAAVAAASAAKAAAMRQRLYSYYQWQLQPGVPTAVVPPSNADRKAAARSAAAAAAAAAATATSASAAADAAEAKAMAEEENEEAGGNGGGEGGLPATYTGKLPPADVDHIFRQCARSVAAKGTREAEARLLRDSPDMFYFLNPENSFHEYYLYLLRQAAPDMEVLGDNLEELIAFLESLETELREELGYVDPNNSAAAAAGGGGGAMNADGAGGVLGDDGVSNAGGVLGGGTAGNNAVAAMWSGGERYEVHDVVDGEEDGEDGDLYAGDGGGLQLESAAVNLKKNAGPTLAEQIEQARRTQTSNKADGAAAAAAAAAAGGGGAGPAPGMHMNVNAGPPAVGASTGSFVSTAEGSTLADKLRAMQMAAMQGGGSGSGSAVGGAPPFMSSSNASQSYGNGAAAEGNTPANFILPQPTAEDLLAAINFGDDTRKPNTAATANSFGAAASPQQRQQQQQLLLQSDYNIGLPQDTFRAPTTEELMALLGNPSLTPPPQPSSSLSGGSVLGGAGNAYAPLGVLRTQGQPFAPPPLLPVNPLGLPPPALPAKALEERPASVLVYPIPDCRRHGGNVRLLLAKSLGDLLNLRVGPTVVVGRVARIDVPNRNVEARALALKRFRCAEQTVYVLRNDRIVDDPERERRELRQRRENREREAEEQQVRRRRREEARKESSFAPLLMPVTDPTSLDALADPSAITAGSESRTTAVSAMSGTAGAAPELRIGVLSSSDEDDSSSGSSSESSSSDEE